MRVVRRSVASLALLCGVVAPIAADVRPVSAACAADPTDVSFTTMIERRTTGDAHFHRMIIGRAMTIRDPGRRGGDAVAVVRVWAHPTGFVPDHARVRFWRPYPNTSLSENFEFVAGDRYVIIARHVHDGSYSFDGGCGQTSRVGLPRYRHLLRLAR